MNPDTTWISSLESYHPYLTPQQKVSKNPQTYCVHNTLSRSAKSRFNCLRLLGINLHVNILTTRIFILCILITNTMFQFVICIHYLYYFYYAYLLFNFI
jgi:hypothetical protein